MDKNWLSIYIYVNNYEEIDTLCLFFVKPLIKDCFVEKKISKYFFIRYYDETGIHMRLRLRITDFTKCDLLKSKIEHGLSTHFSLYPCATNNDKRWSRPIQSHHYDIYMPEYERYGNIEGVKIAEKHFEHSSELAIKILEHCALNISERYLSAMKAIYLLAYASGLRDECIAKYFAIIYCPTVGDERANIIKEFYSKNKVVFLNIVEAANTIINNTIHMDNDSLQLKVWYESCTETFAEMRKIIANNHTDKGYLTYGKLFFPHYEKLMNCDGDSEIFVKILGLLSSYSHMTLNRLGIDVDEEKMIYGLMSVILGNYNKNKMTTDEYK